jgi:hypothetical protein
MSERREQLVGQLGLINYSLDRVRQKEMQLENDLRRAREHIETDLLVDTPIAPRRRKAKRVLSMPGDKPLPLMKGGGR